MTTACCMCQERELLWLTPKSLPDLGWKRAGTLKTPCSSQKTCVVLAEYNGMLFSDIRKRVSKPQKDMEESYIHVTK